MFLSESNRSYRFNLDIYRNCTFYSGKNNYFNNIKGTQNFSCAEQTNLIIGNNCLFSFGIWIRTSDAHLIYDVSSKKRINKSKSVYIGDHVWVGQDVTILKGTHIGSGSIIGICSLIAGKSVPSNTVWGGNPAKLIRSGVFFNSQCNHNFTKLRTKKYDLYEKNENAIFEFDDKQTINFDKFDEKLLSLKPQKKIEFLSALSTAKNRFYIGDTN